MKITKTCAISIEGEEEMEAFLYYVFMYFSLTMSKHIKLIISFNWFPNIVS